MFIHDSGRKKHLAIRQGVFYTITMSIFRQFYPDNYIESTYHIDFEQLKKQGIQGVIFDIDNTLVPHGAPADAKSRELFQKLHRLGIKTMLLSNNKEPRVKSFAGQVDTPYIYKAGKPSVKNYRKAMELMKTDRKSTLFIGDQLFTDVWGAKRAGITSYLVKPIHPKEEIQIVLKRRLEWIVLYFYKKSLKEKKKQEASWHEN